MKPRLDTKVVVKSTINTTWYKDAEIFQRGKLSGCFSGNTGGTNRGDKGPVDELSRGYAKSGCGYLGL